LRIHSCSGRILDLYGSKEIAVDSLLRIRSDSPLRARYESARAPRRARVTDLLILNCLPCPLQARKGRVLSRYALRISCR